MPSRPSKPEATLDLQLRALQPTHRWIYQAQYSFHPEREFRADFAIWSRHSGPSWKPLLVEIDGAKKFSKLGAHQRADGIDRDCRRAAEALLLGYRVLRVSAPMVYDGTAIALIEKLVLRDGA